ncbi:hypothetical protein U1Q18_029325 [Sarracenia purpurea var. burkii]
MGEEEKKTEERKPDEPKKSRARWEAREERGTQNREANRVEDVQTDCKTHKVVVKGEKADPVKVVERVQRKSHRQVELLSPIPKPPAEDAKKVEDQKEVAKPVEKQEEVIRLLCDCTKTLFAFFVSIGFISFPWV